MKYLLLATLLLLYSEVFGSHYIFDSMYPSSSKIWPNSRSFCSPVYIDRNRYASYQSEHKTIYEYSTTGYLTNSVTLDLPSNAYLKGDDLFYFNNKYYAITSNNLNFQITVFSMNGEIINNISEVDLGGKLENIFMSDNGKLYAILTVDSDNRILYLDENLLVIKYYNINLKDFLDGYINYAKFIKSDTGVYILSGSKVFFINDEDNLTIYDSNIFHDETGYGHVVFYFINEKNNLEVFYEYYKPDSDRNFNYYSIVINSNGTKEIKKISPFRNPNINLIKDYYHLENHCYSNKGSYNNGKVIYSDNGIHEYNTLTGEFSTLINDSNYISDVFYHNDLVYFSDTNKDLLHVLDKNLISLRKITIPSPLKIDYYDGFLYLTSTYRGYISNHSGFMYRSRLYKINENNMEVFEIPNYPTKGPFGITVHDNKIYYTGFFSGLVHILDMDGNQIDTLGESNSVFVVDEERDFNTVWPKGLVFDNGNLYVATSSSIVKLSQGKWTNSFFSKDLYYEFSSPFDIDVDINGNFYVVDKSQNQVKILDSTGEIKSLIGSRGFLPTQLYNPEGIAFSESGEYVYIADTGNNRIVKYRKVDRPDTSKAIILAGGDESGNTLWDEAQANANHAFWSLANQGYTKANIHYLNHNTNLDLDGNGEPDDVDGIPSLENIKSALTEWAAEAVDGEPVEDVVLYMIGHGGDGTFELGNGEVLTASQLNAWLDELQAIMPSQVTVIYDGCQSGSFVPILSDNDVQRTVMTSAQADQNAYFQDAISFSHLFWNQVFAGKALSEAFQTTQTSISLAFPNQSPLMDSNGDGITNSDEDYAFVSQQVIGNGTVYSGTAPAIGSVSLTPVGAGESTSTITVSEISDEGGVQSAWGIVTPPYADLTALGTSVQNLPRFDLFKQEDGSYQGSFDGFEQPGTYQVAIYAQDTEGNTSLPVVESINVISPLGRKALLVAGVDASGQFSSAIQKQADHAYSALTGQGYADSTNQSCLTGDSICYLSANTVGTVGVDQALSKEGLEHFLTLWASSETSDLVVYLVGDVVDEAIRLSATDSVTLDELGTWLDEVQSGIEGTLTVIHEGNGSGATVAALGNVGSESKRIVISSSAMDQGSYLPAGGDASFSRYFWGKVAQGGTVEEAFAAGSASLARFQTPQINANGNAFSNEKSDRYQARFHHLGLGILLAANEPVIGEVPLNSELDGGTSELLWADQIISLSELDKVWAVIEPPEYDPITKQTGELIEVRLQKKASGRWQATYDAFDHSGMYTVHYYAQDKQQRISPPRTSYVTQTRGEDAYEPDNTPEAAALLSAFTQYQQWHNFTDTDDIDYVRFDVDPERGAYTIKVDSLESSADTAFSLYDADLNPIALGVAGSPGEYTIDALFADSVELGYWIPESAGRYLLKVQAADTLTSPDINTSYTISIFPTDAPQDNSIDGIITNEDGSPVEGALVYTDENQSIRTDADGYYILKASLNDRSITVEASGYIETTQQIFVTENDQPTLDFVLTTPTNTDNAEPVSASRDGTPAVQAVKPNTAHYPNTHAGPFVVQSLQIDTPAGGATLHQLTINALGESNEATDVKSVTLYHDINQNQQVDAGDIQLGESSTFTSNNGSIDVTLDTPYLLQQGQQQMVVTYELH